MSSRHETTFSAVISSNGWDYGLPSHCWTSLVNRTEEASWDIPVEPLQQQQCQWFLMAKIYTCPVRLLRLKVHLDSRLNKNTLKKRLMSFVGSKALRHSMCPLMHIKLDRLWKCSRTLSYCILFYNFGFTSAAQTPLGKLDILSRLSKQNNELCDHNKNALNKWTRNKHLCHPKLILQSEGIPSTGFSASAYYSACIRGWALMKGLLIEAADYRLWFWLGNQGTCKDLSCLPLMEKKQAAYFAPHIVGKRILRSYISWYSSLMPVYNGRLYNIVGFDHHLRSLMSMSLCNPEHHQHCMGSSLAF